MDFLGWRTIREKNDKPGTSRNGKSAQRLDGSRQTPSVSDTPKLGLRLVQCLLAQ